MGMITLTGTLTCQSEAEAEMVRTYLPEHVRLTSAEPGCLKFEVAQKDDPWVWHLEEAFVDAAAFSAHQTRNAASPWAEKSAALARDFTRVDH
jgi:quinol monooxygenase YgiN